MLVITDLSNQLTQYGNMYGCAEWRIEPCSEMA